MKWMAEYYDLESIVITDHDTSVNTENLNSPKETNE